MTLPSNVDIHEEARQLVQSEWKKMEEASQTMIHEYRLSLIQEIHSLPRQYQEMKLSEIFDLSSENTMDFKMLLFKEMDKKELFRRVEERTKPAVAPPTTITKKPSGRKAKNQPSSRVTLDTRTNMNENTMLRFSMGPFEMTLSTPCPPSSHATSTTIPAVSVPHATPSTVDLNMGENVEDFVAKLQKLQENENAKESLKQLYMALGKAISEMN